MDNKNYKFFSIIFGVLLIFFILSSCTVTVFEKTEFENPNHKKWTILIYMCGDNNLAFNALDDLNEMEAGLKNCDDLNLIVLSDISSDYVSEKYSGTKLYQIKQDNEGVNYNIVSDELSCSYLGINKYVKNNVNVADPYVLQKYIEYSARMFPADHYGLIVWGHGNGWRSSSIENLKPSIQNRAVAFDESSKQYMSISNFRKAIKSNEEINKFDFIGFDCCFGTEIEVLYELKDCCNYFSGVEGLETSEGWNYETLLLNWNNNSDNTGFELCRAFDVMAKKSGLDNYGSFESNKINSFFCIFDDFFSVATEVINFNEGNYLNLINDIKTFYVPGIYSDVYLDIYDLCKKIIRDNDNEILKNKFHLLEQAMLNCKISFEKKLNIPSIGVFYCSLDAEGNILVDFPKKYIHGENVTDQSLFVIENEWYVPSKERNKTFLDKIFND